MARLPRPGKDSGTWGDVLNDFLSQTHDANGSLKANSVNAAALAPGAVSASGIQDGSVTTAKLGTDGAPSLGQVLSYTGSALTWSTPSSSGSVPDANASTKGLIQLTGDLGGTAASPTVPGLATKESSLTAGTTAQYYRGDKSWQSLNKTAVGLANVDNTSDANKPISSATQSALNTKAASGANSDITSLSGLATPLSLGQGGTGSASKNFVDISTDQTVSGVKTFTSSPVVPTPGSSTDAANKSYVDNVAGSGSTPDADATTKGKIQLTGDLGGTAASPTVPGLAGKAPLASPAFTGTPTGITKSHVGLGSVDNTSDASKPISNATQTALDAKAVDSTTVHNTGTETVAGVKTFSSIPVLPVTAPTASTQATTKGYVDGAVSNYANLAPNSTITVTKSGGTWPSRPTSRADIVVIWKGTDPSPPIVSSGTGGMLDNVDMRFVTD